MIEIELPDGTVLEAPDDADPSKVAKAYLSRTKAPKEPAQKEPTPLQQVRASVPGRVAQGMADTGLGALQLLSKIPGVDKSQAQQQQANARFQGIDIPPELLPRSIDQQVRGNEQQYQQARVNTGSEGFDLSRLAGNVASPTNLAIASKIPQGVGLLGKIGSNAASGSATGLLQPVTEGDFFEEKAKQGLVGGLAGGATPLALGGLARMVRPNTRPEVQALLDQGVTPTPGQILGGRSQVLEDKLTSVPIVGDAIASARGKSLDEFNKAAYKRALEPIGGNVPNTVGREAVKDVREQLGAAYDKLLPKISFKADQTFSQEITNLRGMVAQLPKQQADQFEKVFETQVSGKMTPQGLMNGERLKEVESELGRIAKGYASDPSFDNRQLGSAVNELQSLIRQNLVRNNPKYADELSKINKGYAAYTRIRDAASRQGSADGKFTPAQLSAAVRAQDKTVGKRAFSEGTALMQNLSDAGKNTLGSKYPDSGSIGRLALGAGTVGGGYLLEPAMLAGGGLATLPYLPGGRQAMAGLLAKRPEVAGLLAQKLRKSIPYVAPGAGLLTEALVE